MRVIGPRIAAAAVATAIIFNPTVAVAAGTTPAPAQQASQASWLALSMLTPSGAIGLAGTAAQPATDVPPPPPEAAPPPPPPEGNAVAGVPLPVIGIWLVGIALAVYIVTKNHHSRFNIPTSPF